MSPSNDAFLPRLPTLKPGSFSAAPGPRASSRSSSSGTAASAARRAAISSSRMPELVGRVAAGLGTDRRRRRCGPHGTARGPTAGRGRSSGTRSSTRSQLSSKASASAWRAADRTPEARRRRMVRSRAGSASSWSRNIDQRRSKATLELTSSRTSTRGGRPASTGCSDSRRWAKAWRVPMAAPSSWSRAARQRLPDLSVGIVLGPPLELAADPVAELGAGLLGEGDGGDGPQLGPARRDQGHDPVDEGARLPRPRPRLHEQGGAEIAGDAVPGALVGGRGAARQRTVVPAGLDVHGSDGRRPVRRRPGPSPFSRRGWPPAGAGPGWP